MKKSELLPGHKIIMLTNGVGSGRPLEITDIDTEYGIIEMGPYGTSLCGVGKFHKFVRDDGTYEDITDD